MTWGAARLICVCTGPGSFNGIPAGMATAIGLLRSGAPIYGISALDLLAFPHADRAPAQRPCAPAGASTTRPCLYARRPLAANLPLYNRRVGPVGE